MRAFIFDMDGVIIDSEPIHTRTKMLTFQHFGIEFNQADYVHYMGRPTRDMFKEVAELRQRDIDIDDMTAYKHKLFFDILANDNAIAPIGGVRELICNLQQRSVKLALASSSRRKIINLVLDRFSLGRYFSSVLAGSELPKAKPDPAIYLLSAQRLGVAPHECVVLEDAAAGVLAAKRAGMYVIGYRNLNSGYQDLSLADEVVNRYSDIDLNKYFACEAAARAV